tara:strand:+ start:186 stop:497 length:312 start_codon:yes stop_codon:yes gene_type:complete
VNSSSNIDPAQWRRTATTAALLVLGVFIVPVPTHSNDTNHCDLIKAAQNRLGRSMAINRFVISSNDDEQLVEAASQQLAKQELSFRENRRQYEKENCTSIWDR